MAAGEPLPAVVPAGPDNPMGHPALRLAAYGGVYVATAIAWLWLVEGVRPTPWDLVGSAVALAGMLIIVWGWRQGG